MTTKRILLSFPRSETEKPIVYNLVKNYDLVINIFRAKVTPEEYGYLVLDVSGTDENISKGMEYVRTFNVEISDTGAGLSWDESRCTSCGNCLTHCPTGALRIMDQRTRRIGFSASECIDCLSCLKNCPFGACSSLF